jgi:hypothetical protein
LNKDEKYTLLKKIKALILHNIGDVCIFQTDNIIISVFVSTRLVGVVSNYSLLINTVNGCIKVLFNSVTGSLGNMVATETKEYQYYVFKRYRFIGFWFYGFTAIALGVLMTPFITLWLGENYVISPVVVFLLVLDYYMLGHRTCLNNIKSAAGLYEQDQYIALLRGIVNLIASVFLVKMIGLPGVYLGTIIQGTICTITKPIILYKPLFGISSKSYFIDSVKYAVPVLASAAICIFVKKILLYEVTPLQFVILMLVVAVVPNMVFYILFRNTKEFAYFKDVTIRGLRKIKRRMKC